MLSILATRRGRSVWLTDARSRSSGEALPAGSWCLEGSLKPFHHDLRSRLFGGEAGVAPGGAPWFGGLARFAVGMAEAMVVDDGALRDEASGDEGRFVAAIRLGYRPRLDAERARDGT